MADPAATASASAKSAWSAAGKKFSETPAKGPCIPCAAAKKKNPVGPQWEKDAKDVFPGHQSFNDCGLQASRQIVEQSKGKLNMTEKQFMDKAIANCPVDPDGGSSALDRQCVMQSYGVKSTIQDANLASVDAALRDGKGVIIMSDSQVLWGLGMQDVAPKPGIPHAVLLTNGIYNSEGKMTGVDINDTGTGTRYAMSSEDLATALSSSTKRMNVTDDPIWPSN